MTDRARAWTAPETRSGAGFATDWAGASMTVHEAPAGYESTVGAMNARIRQGGAGVAGDPDRAAQILVALAKRDDLPTNLPA